MICGVARHIHEGCTYPAQKHDPLCEHHAMLARARSRLGGSGPRDAESRRAIEKLIRGDCYIPPDALD